jgi:hypothetical protein
MTPNSPCAANAAVAKPSRKTALPTPADIENTIPHKMAGRWFFDTLVARPEDRMQMINFMKNLTIACGFLVLAGAGPSALALDNRR